MFDAAQAGFKTRLAAFPQIFSLNNISAKKHKKGTRPDGKNHRNQ
jgi:hypothetical protein